MNEAVVIMALNRQSDMLDYLLPSLISATNPRQGAQLQ